MGGVVLYIDELYVRPSYRSKGIASRFIEQLIQDKYSDCAVIALEVSLANTRARKFYERIGFVPFGNTRLKFPIS